LSKDITKNPLIAYGNWLATTPNKWSCTSINSALMQFVDLIAVMIPGSKEEVVKNVYSTVKTWGNGQATVVGHKDRLSAPWAALVNGTAAHALDFDDNFDPAKAHASAVLIPAIMSLAEENKLSGLQSIDAYICGLQIMGKIGQGLNPYHRNRGWHATATVGAIGASAACSRLLKLNAKQACYALSISTSMAAGFMSQFGTMTKPLHAGLAAKSGVLSSSLAKNKVTAGINTLNGITGMNHLMVGLDYKDLRDSIKNPEHGQTLTFDVEKIGSPLHIDFYGFRVKRFPNCGSAHRAMDLMLNLRNRFNLNSDKVEKILITAPISHLNNLMHHKPINAMEAKFSMEFAISIILESGKCNLEDFSKSKVLCPKINSIYDKITLIAENKSETEIPTKVCVIMKDGTTHEETTFFPIGSKNLPFLPSEYWDKFKNCSKGLVEDTKYKKIIQKLENLASLESVSTLMSDLKN
jgi:2-methylcitrate dehydratase PrpD